MVFASSVNTIFYLSSIYAFELTKTLENLRPTWKVWKIMQ